jgi:hypothetical protein
VNCFDELHAKKILRIPALSERTGALGEMAGRLREQVKTANSAEFAYNLKC